MIFLFFLYLELNHGQCCCVSTQCNLCNTVDTWFGTSFYDINEKEISIWDFYITLIKSLGESVFTNLDIIILTCLEIY